MREGNPRRQAEGLGQALRGNREPGQLSGEVKAWCLPSWASWGNRKAKRGPEKSLRDQRPPQRKCSHTDFHFSHYPLSWSKVIPLVSWGHRAPVGWDPTQPGALEEQPGLDEGGEGSYLPLAQMRSHKPHRLRKHGFHTGM